jgi:putative transposase
MISEEPALSLSQQCRILELPRHHLYRQPPKERMRDLQLMRLIDELYTACPTMGSRRMSKEITMTHKIPCGRLVVRRLMREMGLHAIYPKKRTTTPGKGHTVYPYLLRNLPITRVNQVWSTDITYIRMERGFMYLTAVIDWYSRKVLSWRLSNTMDVQFCISALEEALERYGKPEIFNTDQGSQYTSDEHTSVLKNHAIKISMDGKGRALDNIFVERLWRSVKQELIYLNEFTTGGELRDALRIYFDGYNSRRRHQSLEYNTPDDIYFSRVTLQKAA